MYDVWEGNPEDYRRIVGKREWLKEMKSYQESYLKLLLRYAELANRHPKNQHYLQVISALRDATSMNRAVMRQAEAEDGMLIYFISSSGVPGLIRTSEECVRRAYERSRVQEREVL